MVASHPFARNGAGLITPHIHPRWLFAAFVLALVVLLAERHCHHDLHNPVLAAVLSNEQVWQRYRQLLTLRCSKATVHLDDVCLHGLWKHLGRLKVTAPDGSKAPRSWHQVRPQDLERWLAQPIRPGRYRAGQELARSSQATKQRRVLRFYAVATAKRWLPGRNPLAEVVPIRPPGPRPRALPLGDVGALLKWWADDRRISIMLCLGYFQLLRVGEMARLSVEDIDLRARPPHMRVQGKGGVEVWMPINPALLPYLRAYLATRPSSGPLLANRRYPGQHLTSGYATGLLARAMRPIVGDSGHALRHTGATELRRLTSDVREIQQAGRWQSLETVQTYLREEPTKLAGVLALLPDPLAQEGGGASSVT